MVNSLFRKLVYQKLPWKRFLGWMGAKEAELSQLCHIEVYVLSWLQAISTAERPLTETIGGDANASVGPWVGKFYTNLFIYPNRASRFCTGRACGHRTRHIRARRIPNAADQPNQRRTSDICEIFSSSGHPPRAP